MPKPHGTKSKLSKISRSIPSLILTILLILENLIFNISPAYASTNTWDFSTAGDYTYDNTKIEFSSGQAQLKATSNWYSTSWSRRKAVTVTGSSAGAQTNYQLKITVPYDSDMQADFDDIRFTDSDGTTLLSYWLESKTDSSTADIWVKIPTIPASPSTTTIYMYYGNSSVSSASSAEDTLLFYDNFDDGSLYDFFKSSSNPILTSAQYPAVYKSGSDYWLYYNNNSLTPTIYKRVCSTETTCASASSTGITGQYPYVWLDGSTYRMIYVESGVGNIKHIRLATSSDGSTFNDQGRILDIGSSGDWDDTYVHDPTEIKVGSTYYLYYAGRTGTGPDNSSIGLATSSTGAVGTYTKQGRMLQPEVSGWDSLGLFDPHIYEYQSGQYMIMFTGWNGTLQQWGYATSSSLTSGWTRASVNPIVWDTQSWERANSIEPACLIEDSKWKCWYRGDSTDDEIGYLYFNQNTTTGLPLIYQKWNFSGGTWTESGGVLSQTDTASAHHYAYTSYTGTNYLVEAKVKHTSSTLNSELMARYTSGSFYSIGPEGVPANIYLAYHSPSYNGIANSVFSQSQNTFYTESLWVNGTALKGKIWLSTDSEPASWTVTGTHATLTSGNSGLYSYASSMQADWIRIRNYVSPEPTASIGSEVILYPTDQPTIYPNTAVTFTSLSGFSETATKNSGEIKYQISNDGGSTWYWYNSGWTTTSSGYAEANTASIINTNISSFPVGSGQFLFKAYLNSDGSQLVQLDAITLTYANGSSGSSSDSSSSSGTTLGSSSPSNQCTNTPPGTKAPWLYSALTKDSSSITLYFTAADSPVNKYVLEYGTSPGNYQYGVQDLGINTNSQMSYQVNSLSPDKTYYFRVRGGNGCASGPWSNEISAKTLSPITTKQLTFTSSELSPQAPTPQPIVKKEELQTQPEGYEIKIKVVDANKNPVAGAKVTLHSKIQETFTDKDGIAQFNNVEKGDHKVLIAYNNFEGEQSLNLTGDVKKYDLNITVEPKNVISSNLTNGIIGIMALIIVILAILLAKALKKNKSRE